MRNTINVVVLLLIAAAVAFLPAGSELAALAGRAVSLAFILVFGLGFGLAYRRFGPDFERIGVGYRTLGLGAVGALVLIFAGWAQLTSGPGGLLVAVALLAAVAAILFAVWQRYRAVV